MQDMLAGQIQLSMFPATVALPQVRVGKVRAYAVTANARIPVAPDIPTVDEAGLPAFTSRSGGDFGCQGARLRRSSPGSMPRWWRPWPIRRCAQRIAYQGLALPDARQQTPEALAAYQKAEIREMVADHQGGQHQGAIGRGARMQRSADRILTPTPAACRARAIFCR
jgi:hypothetical protein